MSTLPLEAIAGAGGLRWFQLYIFEDKKVTQSLVERAAAIGYRALALVSIVAVVSIFFIVSILAPVRS